MRTMGAELTVTLTLPSKSQKLKLKSLDVGLTNLARKSSDRNEYPINGKIGRSLLEGGGAALAGGNGRQ